MNIKKLNEELEKTLNEEADDAQLIERFDLIISQMLDILSKISIQNESDAEALGRLKSCVFYMAQAIVMYNDDRKDTEWRTSRVNRELSDAAKALKTEEVY